MKRLWAPWRMEYVLQKKPEGCILCDKPKEQGKERENLIVHRGETCFIIMNYYPYNNGHVMVVPYRHTADLMLLNANEQSELISLVAKSSDILKRAFRAQGMNIGMNLGSVAGAGIDDHLHFHVVPRWNGDTNYMPITGHTKVLSQGLYESWEILRGYF